MEPLTLLLTNEWKPILLLTKECASIELVPKLKNSRHQFGDKLMQRLLYLSYK